VGACRTTASIDALTSAIVLLDQFGRVIFLNAAAEHLLKQRSELFVRRDRFCARYHADAESLQSDLIRLMGGITHSIALSQL